MHFSTSSAIFASLDSGLVPFAGKGLTIVRSKANNDLEALQLFVDSKTRLDVPEN